MPRRFRKLTAWLGIVAIWLTVLLPLASQLQASALRLDAPLCSADSDSGGHSHSRHDGASRGLHLDACGYCSLLAHSPALGSAPPVLPGGTPVAQIRVPIRLAVTRQPARYSRAYPRAPPLSA
jgi:hypothetical protein